MPTLTINVGSRVGVKFAPSFIMSSTSCRRSSKRSAYRPLWCSTARRCFNVGRTDFTYYPGMIRIPEANAPDIKNKSFRISADVDVPQGGANGIIVTQGGRFGGWGLLVLDGKLMFAYAFSNQDGDKYPVQKKYKFRIAAADALAPGKHTIGFDFTYDGGGLGKGGQGTLTVDGKKVGDGRIELTQPIRFSLDERFDVGEDTGSPVIDEYR